MRKVIVSWLFIFSCLLLFLYSFTQVDLNLTLSRSPFVHTIIKSFQYIGYYNRFLSTEIYIGILIVMCACYFYFLYLAYKQKLKVSFVWKLLFIVIPILVLSYNAFSYDLFNYLFYPKIILHYHQNPYLQTPQDYPNDPMVNFMRWTGQTYPYGPVWLAVSVPLSYLGMGFLIPTLIIFKLFITFSFLGTLYYIQKIVKMIAPKMVALSVVFIGLSPLFLIESVVSSHNDIVMLFFALGSLYYLLRKNYKIAIVLFALSVGIKFATIFALPVYLLIGYLQYRKIAFKSETLFVLLSLLMGMAVIFASSRTNFQPWYLIFYLPFAALALQKYYLFIPSIILMSFSLLTYAPYLYLGNSDPPLPFLLNLLNLLMIFSSISSVLAYRLLLRKKIV